MFSVREIVVAALSYGVAHVVVLCIYRLTLHPYAKYPGPFLAKLTILYAAYHAYIGDMHLNVERQHQKYGKFVRYGPNRLLVNSTDGFHDIYGNLKKVKKSESYHVHGDENLLGIQDKKYYAKSKKIFQQGFSDTANREHEPKVIKVVDIFIEKLSENETPGETSDGWTNPKDMSLWCNYLTTDVVSKVIFSTTWDLLTSTANRGISETFKAVTRLVGVLHYWPHIKGYQYTALLFLPHLAFSFPAMKKFSLALMASSAAVRKDDPSIKDVFGVFTTARDPDTGELALGPVEVRRNTGNFVIAGSDTTASAISGMFFYLAHNPDAYAKVAKEVRAAFPSVASIRTGPALNNCAYLLATIKETLRMSPVAAQPLWREADPGGCIVDGQFIPAGLEVASGIFSLHHNASVFPDPYKFDIERWIADPTKDEEEEKERLRELNKNWAPFSIGPRQCIAKNFAWMEMLLSMANVFLRLDFEVVGKLGEGRKGLGEGREREGEFQFKSYFTSYMEGPMIRFKVRDIGK